MCTKQITLSSTRIPELTRATSQNSWMMMIRKWGIAAYPFNKPYYQIYLAKSYQQDLLLNVCNESANYIKKYYDISKDQFVIRLVRFCM